MIFEKIIRKEKKILNKFRDIIYRMGKRKFVDNALLLCIILGVILYFLFDSPLFMFLALIGAILITAFRKTIYGWL